MPILGGYKRAWLYIPFSITLHTQLLTNLTLRKTRAMNVRFHAFCDLFLLFPIQKRQAGETKLIYLFYLNVTIEAPACWEQHKKSLDNENNRHFLIKSD